MESPTEKIFAKKNDYNQETDITDPFSHISLRDGSARRELRMAHASPFITWGLFFEEFFLSESFFAGGLFLRRFFFFFFKGSVSREISLSDLSSGV